MLQFPGHPCDLKNGLPGYVNYKLINSISNKFFCRNFDRE